MPMQYTRPELEVRLAPYSYMVEAAGPVFHAVDAYGKEISYNANAKTVIEAALAALTAGRTWKETVILRGDLGDVYDVILPSYTHIKGIDAKMRMPTGQATIFKQTSSDLYSIEIEGLSLDSQTVKTGRAIYLYYFDGAYRYAYDIDIHNNTIANFQDGCRTIAERMRVYDNVFKFNVENIAPIYGKDVKIRDNWIYMYDPLGATDCWGLHLIDDWKLEVSGNHFKTTSGVGTTAFKAIEMDALLYNIDIHDNFFEEVSSTGLIRIGNAAGVADLMDIGIHHNHVKGTNAGAGGNAQTFVRVQGNNPVTDLVIDHNILKNYGELFALIAGANVRCKITDNQMYNGNNGFRLIGATYQVELKDNAFYNMLDNPTIGTGTLYPRGNIGYLFENWGYCTGTGAQQTIAHGCKFTPTASQVFLSERTTGLAVPYQSAAPDAVNIYVFATLNKDYNWRVSYLP